MRRPELLLAVLLILACGHPAAVTGPSTSTPAAKTALPAETPPAPDPCAPEIGPATQALQTFRAELLTAAAADPQSFQQSVQDRVATFQQTNRTLLLAHAEWSLRRLPTLSVPDLDALPDDPRVSAEVLHRMQGIVNGALDPTGNPLQAYLGLVAMDPLRAFAAIRGAVLSAASGLTSLERIYENVLEGLAPPRVVRVNDDLTHPILALPKRAGIFAVWFDRDEARGLFTAQRIRWVSRQLSAQPVPAIVTAEDALAAFANAVDALEPEEDDTTANISARALERVSTLAKQWLDPHTDLLRKRGACECKKLPRATLPDLSDWKEEEGLSSLLGLPGRFPRLRWDVLQAFLFLRTTIDARTMAVGDYSGLALIDGLVPPPVARANDDVNEPTLFLVEGGTAVVVDFSSTPTRGFFPANVRHYQK